MVAGIDCADDNNTATCREFEIMGYPTLKLFPSQSPPLVVSSISNHCSYSYIC